MRKYCTTQEWKPAEQTPNSAFPCLMCSSELQLFPALLTTTLLSLGLVPHPVLSFPQQVSHGSDISNILGSPRQSLLHLHSFTQWLSWRNTTATHLASADFLSQGGRFHNPYFVSLIRRPEAHGQSCQVLLLSGAGAWASCLAFCFQWFPSLKVFFNSLFTSWKLSWMGSCPEVTIPFILFSIGLFISLNTGLSSISWCLFFFKLYIFFISPCSACLFNIYVRLNTNNNTAQSVPGYLEIASANDINQKVFSLLSGRLGVEWARAENSHILCQNTARMISRPLINITLFWNLLGQAVIIYIALSTTIFAALTSLAC